MRVRLTDFANVQTILGPVEFLKGKRSRRFRSAWIDAVSFECLDCWSWLPGFSFDRCFLFLFVLGTAGVGLCFLSASLSSSVRVNGRLSCFSSILGYLLFRTIDIGFPIIESSSAFACFIC